MEAGGSCPRLCSPAGSGGCPGSLESTSVEGNGGENRSFGKERGKCMCMCACMCMRVYVRVHVPV